MPWQQITAVLGQTEDQFDQMKNRLWRRLGRQRPYQIVPYIGYGSRHKLFLRGRVLVDKGVRPAGDADTVWDDLVNMYRRLESDLVRGGRVAVSGIRYPVNSGLLVNREQVLVSGGQEVVTDEQGYFALWLELERPLPPNIYLQQIELELIEPRLDGPPVTATGLVQIPPQTAQFGVISDLDDTVLQSHVTHLLKMARTVFMGNARTRMPFPGVAAFYRALEEGTAAATAGSPEWSHNALFYLSSSPWNLYDLIVDVFRLQKIPLAPIFLREWGVAPDTLPIGHRRHKLAVMHQLFDFYPDLPFILLGDCGQEDPEIYHQIVHDYPERILAVYIRSVSRSDRRRESVQKLASEVAAAGSTLLLTDSTLEMAHHAAAQGWIAPESLEAIRAEKAQDEAPPTQLEEVLGQ
ncbi:MAG: phosphatase domain-containing protein [Chloroflexota bacterium]